MQPVLDVAKEWCGSRCVHTSKEKRAVLIDEGARRRETHNRANEEPTTSVPGPNMPARPRSTDHAPVTARRCRTEAMSCDLMARHETAMHHNLPIMSKTLRPMRPRTHTQRMLSTAPGAGVTTDR